MEPELFPFVSETGWWGYRTVAGEVAIPCRFEVARPFAEGLAAVQQDWRWGFVDPGGSFRIEPRFEEARSFSEGLAAVVLDDRWSLVDRQGAVVIAGEPGESVGDFSYGVATVRHHGADSRTVWLVDRAGRRTAVDFEDVGAFSEGLAPASRDDEHGFIDRSGRVVIPLDYVATWPFSEGLAAVAVSPREYGFVDRTGRLAIPPQYRDAGPFHGGLAPAREPGGQWGYIDRDGRWAIAPRYDFARGFRGALARVEIRPRQPWGFIDCAGRLVIGPRFRCAWPFSEGLAAVGVSSGPREVFRFIDRSGQFAVAGEFERAQGFSEGLACVGTRDRWGYIDTAGRWVIPPRFRWATGFRGSVAVIELDSGRFALIDRSGAAVSPEFDRLDQLDFLGEGLVRFTESGQTGLRDLAGRVAVPARFDAIMSFSEGLAMVQVGERYGWIDRTGRVVIEPRFTGGHGFHEGLAVVQHGSLDFAYVDPRGETVITGLRWAADFSEGLAYVDANNGVGYIDRRGRIRIPGRFSGFSAQGGEFSEGLAAVEVEPWGYVDRQGRLVWKSADWPEDP